MADYNISMIIPTFNVENDLKRAMDSLINQTIGFENIEVVIVDDCSTDNTRNIILSYSEEYCNIKHIFLDSNSGSAGKPRNIGVKNASADYVMFLDNDDEYLPEACKIFYDAIIENDVNLIVCSKPNVLYSEKDKPEKITESPIFEEINVLENPDALYQPISSYSGAMWNIIFKKDFLSDNNISCLENLPEDVYFMHKCYYLNPNILLLTNLKLYNHYFYRISGQSISVTLSPLFLHNVFKVFQKLQELSIKFDNTEAFFIRYCGLFFDDLAYDIVISDLSKEDRICLIKNYASCAKGLNPPIQNKFYSIWCKWACEGRFSLTYYYSLILKFSLKLKFKS